MSEEAPEERTPVMVYCHRCPHAWVVGWLPMEMGAFGRLMKKATCPMCGKADQIFMGPKIEAPTTTRPEGPRNEETT
jgi:hypothetical protein